MKKIFLLLMIMGTFSLYGKKKPTDAEKLKKIDTFMKQLCSGSLTKKVLFTNMLELMDEYAQLRTSSDAIVQFSSTLSLNLLKNDFRKLVLTGNLPTRHYSRETLLSFRNQSHRPLPNFYLPPINHN